MTQHTTNFNTLQKRIMRRVYYTYAIRLATHPIVTHAIVLGLSAVIFAKLVFVAAVYRNMMQVQVGELGSYMLRIVANADTATLVVVGLMICTIWSLQWKLRLPSVRQMHTA